MKDWLSRRKTMAEILAEIDLSTDEEQVARSVVRYMVGSQDWKREACSTGG
jgi:hypothetical protein